MNGMKFLSLVLVLTCVGTIASAKPDTKDIKSPECDSDKAVCSVQMVKPTNSAATRKEAWESGLSLTPKQREELKQLRIEKDRELEVLQDQIKMKEKEIQTVKLSRVHTRIQEEKIARIDKDIATINKKILTVKYHKQKQFEAILTSKQMKQYHRIKKNTTK